MRTLRFLQRRGMGREGACEKGGHSGVGGQLSARPYSTAPTKCAMANLAIDRNGMPFYHDAARRVATFFEKWNFLIETYLRARGENPPKRLNLYGTFAAVSPLEYGGLKPILPFLEGRSAAACRVVILLAAVPSPYQPLTIPPPSPYHRRTIAVPSSLHPRISP